MYVHMQVQWADVMTALLNAVLLFRLAGVEAVVSCFARNAEKKEGLPGNCLAALLFLEHPRNWVLSLSLICASSSA